MDNKKSDYTLFITVMTILAFGLIMLSSASSALGQARFDDSFFYIKRQLIYGAIPGLISLLVLSKINYKIFEKLASPIYMAMIAILVAVFIPGIGSSHNTSAQSWIAFGSFGLQPAEFAKLGLIIFYAAYLNKYKARLSDLQTGFLPAIVMGMIPIMLVILQPDIGTVSIMFSIVFGMLFVANTQLKHMSLFATAGVIGLLIMVLIAPYRAARLTIFLHPELDPQGIGYQTSQALLAVGSGGVLGLGLGRSRQKFQYLPEVHADSIFAVISEEMGFVVTSIFVWLFIYLFYRLIMISKQTNDGFGKLYLQGLLFWIMSQTFLNIGAIIGLLPLTGVPLPFVSHGGTSLFILLSAIGIALNISKYAHKKNSI